MYSRGLGKMKKDKLYIVMFSLVMLFSLVSILPTHAKAEAKFTEAELKKIYFASWKAEVGKPVTISEKAYGDMSWEYMGVSEQRKYGLEFKEGNNVWIVQYGAANKVLFVTCYYDGDLYGLSDTYMYEYRINGKSEVTAYDIFEGEGISLIGDVSSGSSDITEEAQVETKPDKVGGTKAVNKEGNKLYLTWKAVTDADGYQIVYAADSKFTKDKKAVSVGASVYKKTVSKLTKNKTYYVKVRAYKLDDAGKKVYGSYSAVSKIKITK